MTAPETNFNPPVRHDLRWRGRDFYRFWTIDRVRFADLDPMGHVNNNSYGIYVEGARVALLSTVVPDFWRQPVATVLKAIHIEYHQELLYPNTLDIGVKIVRMGGSSISTVVGIFTGDEKNYVCHATALSTGVVVEREARKPIAIPDNFRQLFAPYE